MSKINQDYHFKVVIILIVIGHLEHIVSEHS